jgi:hypothetical protein
LDIDVTNTASASGSLFVRARLGTAIRFIVGAANGGGGTSRVVAGEFQAGISDFDGSGTGALLGTFGIRARSDGNIGFVSGADTTVANDTVLVRDAADTLAQRRSTTAQTFRIYNTFTDANNHERGFLKWSSNVFQIGTEKGSGGGTARALEFQTDGVTRLTIATNGQVTAGAQINTPIIRSTGTWLDISDSASGPRFGFFSHGGLLLRDSGYFGWNASGTITSSSTGDLRLFRDAAAVLALRNDANAQTFRIYNTVSGTGNVNFDRINFRWASNEFIIDAEAGGTGTLRGIKIGSATSSLLGFYGATPVDRPATVADPAGGGTVDTEARTAINDIIDRLQELGLIA